MNLTRKLQRTNKEQYILTIPKNIVQLLEWKDKELIEFGMERGKITISIAAKTEKNLARRLQKTNKDQYILTIPKTLVQLLEWKDKELIEFGMERGKITITRIKGKKGDRNA